MRNAVVGGLIAAAMTVIGVGAGVAQASPAHPTKGDVITFDVYSDTTPATVSYMNGGNILRQRYDSFTAADRLPDGRYHRSYSFRSAVPEQILALRIQQEGAYASCAIHVNGVLRSQHTAHGFRAAALCGTAT